MVSGAEGLGLALGEREEDIELLGLLLALAEDEGDRLALAEADGLKLALALTQLGYGWSMDELDFGILHKWFSKAQPVQVKFPDVAATLAKHLGEVDSINADLVFDLWSKVEVTK